LPFTKQVRALRRDQLTLALRQKGWGNYARLVYRVHRVRFLRVRGKIAPAVGTRKLWRFLWFCLSQKLERFWRYHCLATAS